MHRIDRLTQSRVTPGELGRSAFAGKSLAVETVQVANTVQPRYGPIDKPREGPLFDECDQTVRNALAAKLPRIDELDRWLNRSLATKFPKVLFRSVSDRSVENGRVS